MAGSVVVSKLVSKLRSFLSLLFLESLDLFLGHSKAGLRA